MVRVFGEKVAQCAICGEVACERDLWTPEDEEEADLFDIDINDFACAECAGEE